MYYYAAMKFQITIVHRYLVKGYTQLECDSVHARVEKRSKHKDVYVPYDWYGLMKSAKVKKPPYQVHVVKVIYSHSGGSQPPILSGQRFQCQKSRKLR